MIPSREARFRAFCTEHEPVLRGMALRLTGNAADASDLVQDAFERALQNFERLLPGSNERAWVVTILHNLFIDRCRKGKREGTRVDADDVSLVAPESSEESSPLWANLTAEDLRQAVEELEPGFREVYRMKALENRSYKEIASDLGIPMATVGTRLLRARNKLRQLLSSKTTASAAKPTRLEKGSVA